MEALDNLFASFASLRVLVIGDVMLDTYVWGKTQRISPEAPVPIVHATHKEDRLGGAANVALNIAKLGANPLLCTCIGQDNIAQSFKQCLSKEGISYDGVVESPTRTSTQKTRILSHFQHMLRVDEEINTPLSETEDQALRQYVTQALKQNDVLLFRDYDKGLLSTPLIEFCIKEAQGLGVPVVVDPKRKNFFAYKGVNLFKPNLKELEDALGIDLSDFSMHAIEHHVGALRKRLSVETLMVTLSDKGIYAKSSTGNYYGKAKVRKVADVSGAGDAVIALMALCVGLRIDLGLGIALANLAGALACELAGVAPVHKSDLLRRAKASTWIQKHFRK